MEPPTLLSPTFMRLNPKASSRSPSRSPTRQRITDDILSDLSPAVTLEQFTSASGALRSSIEAASPTQRAFGIRAAIASKKIQEWVTELSAWPWPEGSSDGFELPAAKRRKVQAEKDHTSPTAVDDTAPQPSDIEDNNQAYWGSLPEKTVRDYESRIDEILEDMEDLDVEEIKGQVLSTHVQSRSRPTSSQSVQPVPSTTPAYTKMDDFTAVITATVLQSLPNLSRLNGLMDVWSVRLALLREVPAVLLALNDVEIALRSGWNALDIKTSAASPDIDPDSQSHTAISREEFETIRDNLQGRVTRLGQRLDHMLDALVGREDTIPETWLDRMEVIEQDYGEWVVCGDRIVSEGEWAKLRAEQERLRRLEEKSLREEEERLRREEAERLRREEEERVRRAEEESVRREEEERMRKAEKERLRIAEEERLREEESERRQKAKEERLRLMELERRQRAEEESLRKGEEERLRRVKEEQLQRAEEERVKRAEEERLCREEEERLHLEKQEKRRQEDEYLRRKAEDEKLRRIEEEQRLRKAEIERLLKKQEELFQRLAVERQRKAEEERQDAERIRKAEEDRLAELGRARLAEELQLREKEERLRRIEEKRLRQAENQRQTQLRAAEEERIRAIQEQLRHDEEQTRLQLEQTKMQAKRELQRPPEITSSRIGRQSSFAEPQSKLQPESDTHAELGETQVRIGHVNQLYVSDKGLPRSESMPSTTTTSDSFDGSIDEQNLEDELGNLESSQSSLPDSNAPSSPRVRKEVDEDDWSDVVDRDQFKESGFSSILEVNVSQSQPYVPPTNARVVDISSLDKDPTEKGKGHSRVSSYTSTVTGYAVSDPSPQIYEAEPTEYFRPVSSPGEEMRHGLPEMATLTPRLIESFAPQIPDSSLAHSRPDSSRSSNLQSEHRSLDILTEDDESEVSESLGHQSAGSEPFEGQVSRVAPASSSHLGSPVLKEIIIRRRSSTSSTSTIIHDTSNGSVMTPPKAMSPRLDQAQETPTLDDENDAFTPHPNQESPSIGWPRIYRQEDSLSPQSSPPALSALLNIRELKISTHSDRAKELLSPDSPSTPLEPPLLENVDVSPAPLLSNPLKTSEDQLQQQISEILESIPAKIHLSSEPELEPQRIQVKKRRSLSSALRPLSRAATPSFTLAPAHRKTSRPRAQNGNPEIKLYHLSRSTGEAPIKLFVRLVGERGERVMVRVGGGWADLGAYLKEYASHHGRRTDKDGKVEVQDMSPRVVSNGSMTSFGRSSPISRPGSSLDQRRPSSSLAIRKTRLSVGEDQCAEPRSPRSPRSPTTPHSFTSSSLRALGPGPNDFSSPPPAASALTATNSRPSSRLSWATPEAISGPRPEDEELVLAGPKGRKIEMSAENAAWVESMKEKVRQASAEKEKQSASAGDFGSLGRVGGTKRLFRRGGQD